MKLYPQEKLNNSQFMFGTKEINVFSSKVFEYGMLDKQPTLLPENVNKHLKPT
jgi:hypothetical protein